MSSSPSPSPSPSAIAVVVYQSPPRSASALHSRASKHSLSSLFARCFTNVIPPHANGGIAKVPIRGVTPPPTTGSICRGSRGSRGSTALGRAVHLAPTLKQPDSSSLRTRSSCYRRRAAPSVIGLFAVSIALHTTLLANSSSACRLRAGLAQPSAKRATRAIRDRTSAVVAKLDFGLVGAASRLGICPGMSTLPYLVRLVSLLHSPAFAVGV
jgi:hypothetical protein